MEALVTGIDMKNIDSYTINKIGIPSLVLMERAAFSVYEEIIKLTDNKDKIFIACGTGNNGADGVAIGRMLLIQGYCVVVNVVGDMKNASQAFIKQIEIYKNIQGEIVDDFHLSEYNVIVDAIFGVGLSRNVEDKFYKIIEKINHSLALKVSVDIASGLCSSSGRVLGIALKADVTVTFARKKIGQLINYGLDYTGKLILKEIGYPADAYNNITMKYLAYNNEDLKLLPKRDENSNKGTYGKVLVIAGTKNMAGAAYLSALSSYRMGSGLVEILTVNENREILQTKLPEAIIKTFDSEIPDLALIDSCLKEADVIIIGPGLGLSDTTYIILERVLKVNKKTVVDADALNVIASNQQLTNYYHEDIIITPHIGEMSRLTNRGIVEIKDNIISSCTDYALKYNINCVLKDAGSVISNGKDVYINLSGNSGMATAGSGDVLTGIIGGLMAIGLQPFTAASLGAYIHGRAGDIMADKIGKIPLMASDIIEGIIWAIRKE